MWCFFTHFPWVTWVDVISCSLVPIEGDYMLKSRFETHNVCKVNLDNPRILQCLENQWHAYCTCVRVPFHLCFFFKCKIEDYSKDYWIRCNDTSHLSKNGSVSQNSSMKRQERKWQEFICFCLVWFKCVLSNLLQGCSYPITSAKPCFSSTFMYSLNSLSFFLRFEQGSCDSFLAFGPGHFTEGTSWLGVDKNRGLFQNGCLLYQQTGWIFSMQSSLTHSLFVKN